MSIYRSAMGKTVDMSALLQKNEKVRAVGNMKVNARGDTIDAHGRIVQPVTEKVGKAYAKTVGNRSANPVKQPQKLQPDPVRPPPAQLLPEELELEESFNDDLEVEQIKEEELKKASKKK